MAGLHRVKQEECQSFRVCKFAETQGFRLKFANRRFNL